MFNLLWNVIYNEQDWFQNKTFRTNLQAGLHELDSLDSAPSASNSSVTMLNVSNSKNNNTKRCLLIIPGCVLLPHLFANLHNIFICQYMFFSASLRLMLGRPTPHPCMRKLGHDPLVQPVAKFFNGGAFRMQNDWFVFSHRSWPPRVKGNKQV